LGLLSKFDWLAAISASAACSGLKISENSLFLETVSLNCIRHHAVFGNYGRRDHMQEGRFCGHFSRVVAGNFWSLRGDIVSRDGFGASVSGGGNPVPNSTWMYFRDQSAGGASRS